jgi:hypothetical protein
MGSTDTAIPFIATNQASPEVTANTAVDSLDKQINHQLSIGMPGSGDLTLTKTQFIGALFFNITGAISGDQNVIVPNTNDDSNPLLRLFVAYNNTTGGHNLTFKTVGGTGVTLANSDGPTFLYCDGVNVVALKTH